MNDSSGVKEFSGWLKMLDGFLYYVGSINFNIEGVTWSGSGLVSD